MRNLDHFYNEGLGWICRHCERELSPGSAEGSKSRLLREGESEGRVPKLSMHAIAKWADPAQTILECPRCGVTELADKS